MEGRGSGAERQGRRARARSAYLRRAGTGGARTVSAARRRFASAASARAASAAPTAALSNDWRSAAALAAFACCDSSACTCAISSLEKPICAESWRATSCSADAVAESAISRSVKPKRRARGDFNVPRESVHKESSEDGSMLSHTASAACPRPTRGQPRSDGPTPTLIDAKGHFLHFHAQSGGSPK